jgi:hypothetical protein
MADLVDGRYPQVDAQWSMLGQPVNVSQSDIPVFSNLRALGLGNPTDGALAATGVACAVPIPVDYGAIISKVSLLVGATAEATGTHAWAALYSGRAGRVGQVRLHAPERAADHPGERAERVHLRLDHGRCRHRPDRGRRVDADGDRLPVVLDRSARPVADPRLRADNDRARDDRLTGRQGRRADRVPDLTRDGEQRGASGGPVGRSRTLRDHRGMDARARRAAQAPAPTDA